MGKRGKDKRTEETLRKFHDMVNQAIQNNADIVMGALKKVTELNNLNQINYDVNSVSGQICIQDEIYELLFNKRFPLIMASCAKLYKKYIFENLRFDEGKLHEDEFIIHKTLNKANKFVYVDLPLYNYLQRGNSITTATYNVKRLHVLEALENRIAFTKENRPQYEKDAILQYMKIGILCYYRVKKAKLDKSILQDIKSKIDFYYKRGYRNLLIRLFYLCPLLLEIVIKNRL